MKTLIVGASGATGLRLTEQLLNRGVHVKAIVRSSSSLPDDLKNRENLELIIASITDLSNEDLVKYTKGCDAIASCLGHNPTLKGMFGKPRRLVTDTLQRLCDAVMANSPDQPVRFVLMSTIAISNHDLNEQISRAQKRVMGILRLFVPPHIDNENAAEYLRVEVGQKNNALSWSAVRPSSLINEDQVTDYEIYPSPISSAISNSGKTSRINVGHFMADLITEKEIWDKWKGQMPVIYNKSN